MSARYVGIEDARKNIGDLVTAAQQGTDTILTRNGRPIARITAYQPEDTMAALNLADSTATVIARARTNSGLTAPEFDYDIAINYDKSINGIGGIHSPLGAATYEIAGERGVDFDQLWEELQPELHAYATRCKARKYSGWSSAARSRGQRIAYAD